MIGRWRTRGFTLIEVLVALAILAITMLLAYRATAALTDGEVRLSAEATRWRALDAAFGRLEADMRQALPRAVRDGDRREPPWSGAVDAGGNSTLAFSRAGPEFTLEPGIAGQRIGYRLDNAQLEVLYWPALDNLAATRPAVYTLLDEVAQFRVDYLDGAGTWTDRWPLFGESDLPRAARVRMTLAGGETIERWFALR